jgi:CRISPR-associated protein Cas1
LYALTTAVVYSLGYLPSLGFIHTASMRAFVLDIADIYKPETTLMAAFETVGLKSDATEDDVVARLKTHLEDRRVLQRMPKDIETLLEGP